MEVAVGERDLKRLPQRRLNFIDGYISTYCYINNLPKLLEQIKQENKFKSVLCDLECDHTRENKDRKNRAIEAEENRWRKSEEKKVRQNDDKLRGIES